MNTIIHRLPKGEVRCDFCNKIVKAKEDLEWYKTSEFEIHLNNRMGVKYKAGIWGACDDCRTVVPVASDDRVEKMTTLARAQNPNAEAQFWYMTWLGFFASVEKPTDASTVEVKDPNKAWEVLASKLHISDVQVSEEQGIVQVIGIIDLRAHR